MNRLVNSQTAWLVVALLCPVALLNYLDRQILAAMKTSVMHDIPTIESEANWGFMLGQFKWVYAFFSPLGGMLADRFSRKWVICGSLFVWSLITWWTGQVTTYDELLWTRSLMGISEALYIPAGLALITDFHPGPTRSRAVSLHQMAIYCGVIAGGFSGHLAANPDWGWRSAFTICGICGIVYALPLSVLLSDSPAATKDSTSTPPVGLGASLAQLLTNYSFLLLVIYFTLPALAGWVVRDWMPAILEKRYNIGAGEAGVSATLYWQVAAIVGVLFGGTAADRWMKTNLRGRIYVSALGMALIVPAIFGVGIASTLEIAIGFLILFGLGWGLFDCNNMPILCQIVPPRLRATGYGVMNMVSISCGGLADWGFGVMRDREVPLPMIFSIFAGLGLFSIILVLMIRPKTELLRGNEAEPATH
jgi:MFS family permease